MSDSIFDVDDVTVDGDTFEFSDVEGDTITVTADEDGLFYVRNQTADEGTYVVVQLPPFVAAALGKFLGGAR